MDAKDCITRKKLVHLLDLKHELPGNYPVQIHGDSEPNILLVTVGKLESLIVSPWSSP
jgi:hypothetical protein